MDLRQTTDVEIWKFTEELSAFAKRSIEFTDVKKQSAHKAQLGLISRKSLSE